MNRVLENCHYGEIIDKLNSIEKSIIDETHIKDWFEQNVDRYDNIRLLKTKMENAIFEELTERLISSGVLDDEVAIEPPNIDGSDFM